MRRLARRESQSEVGLSWLSGTCHESVVGLLKGEWLRGRTGYSGLERSGPDSSPEPRVYDNDGMDSTRVKVKRWCYFAAQSAFLAP